MTDTTDLLSRLRAALERIDSYSRVDDTPAAKWIRDTAREALAPHEPATSMPMNRAATDVLAERRRQIEREGYVDQHDDDYQIGELVGAAIAYCQSSIAEHCCLTRQEILECWWPDDWAEAMFKPKDPRRDLVRAGALILAEIERLDRAAGLRHEPATPGSTVRAEASPEASGDRERLSPEPVASSPTPRPVITLHGFELHAALEALGGELDTDISIAHFEASPSEDDGEPMEAGHYLWFTDYPEEGRIFLTTDPPKGYDDPAPETQPESSIRRTTMTDEQIKHMVDRFLGWRLPENFSPDDGISFNAEYNAEYNAARGLPPSRRQPSGTNLFDATQAEAMVRYMVEGMPSPEPVTGSSPWRPYVKGGVPASECLFWVVPKTAEEAPRSAEGAVITATFEPNIVMGRDGCWSSLSKATHWAPLPSPPSQAECRAAGQCGCEEKQ